MASGLQNAFTRTLGSLSKTSSIKQIFSHGSLYFGIFIYTAIGAKVGGEWMFHYTPSASWVTTWRGSRDTLWHMWRFWDFLTPQVFQLLELPAETEKLETHQALLVTQRAILLQSIYNSSSDPGDNITAFKEVISDVWMRIKHQLSSGTLWGAGPVRGGVQWGLLRRCGHREQGLYKQLGLHPVLLLRPHHPDYNRYESNWYNIRKVSKPEIFKTFCRLWKLCSGNIRGPIFLSIFWNYRNPFHAVCPRGCRRNIRGNPPTGLGQKQDETNSYREKIAPYKTRVLIFYI